MMAFRGSALLPGSNDDHLSKIRKMYRSGLLRESLRVPLAFLWQQILPK